ncbi:MAG: plastocyanin/azurin family copper-binding protein [Cyanobacteria bacterium]|nr:plastocyanin/azurin family copper-binding protein [Cyanobacteriota bacterium]MDW8201103.1 plastocyanin/azurin family copper-binding protein [Cyanobacteriota bacterium SKYGB_h_bin112]
MNWHVKIAAWLWGCIAGLLLWGGWLPSAANAATTVDLARQPVIEQAVSLGTSDNRFVFVPDHLTFKVGDRYKLVLSNPSTQKHYFTAKDFADSIWTQKVDAGKVEIKGAIHDLELKPGASADWVFVPMKSGTYSLRCSIPGHAEAGMVGTLAIVVN